MDKRRGECLRCSSEGWKWTLQPGLTALEGGKYFLHVPLRCQQEVSSAISGFTNMSPEDYRNVFWSQLKDAIDQMLTHPPGSYKPISYEQVGD